MRHRSLAVRSNIPGAVTWIAFGGLAAVGVALGVHLLQPPMAAVFAGVGAAVLACAGGGMAVHHARNGLRIAVDEARAAFAESGDDAADGSILEGLPAGLDALVADARHRIGTAEELSRRCAEKRRELDLKVRVLDHQRRHLEAILNALGDAVLVTDAFGELVIANEAAARLLEFDLSASVHQPIDRIVDDPALTRMIQDVREARNTTVRRSVEHSIEVDGHTRFYQITLGGVRNDRQTRLNGDASGSEQDGAPERANGLPERRRGGGVVTILRDITRDKEIAEMKSDFVSRVSHELRTPLSSIKAYVEMLVDGEAEDEESRAEFYRIIQSESDRLSRLIDNILSISRIESGVVKVTRENLSLAQLIKDAIDVVLPQAQAKSITLTQEEAPLYFQVHADRDMIFQVLINLISNAVKYTPEGGTVMVSVLVDEHAGTVETAVRDTGAGIPEEALPHVFDKFYRVSSHGKLAKGTGLGLALVKHVVETVHHGKVAVTSKVGQGSTFIITLPRVTR